jgi:hypothetical protein
MKPLFFQGGLSNWLNFRLNTLSCFIIFFSSLIPVIMFHINPINGISSSAAGLAITYSILITQVLSQFIENLIQTETEMNSVERYK